MASSKPSLGTKVFIGTTAAGDEVADLLDISGLPGITVETMDDTGHEQADRFRKIISTLADLGELEMTVRMTAAGIDALRSQVFVDEADYGISWPQFGGTPITLDFKGTLTRLQPQPNPVDGKLTVQCAIKPSGIDTWGGLPP